MALGERTPVPHEVGHFALEDGERRRAVGSTKWCRGCVHLSAGLSGFTPAPVPFPLGPTWKRSPLSAEGELVECDLRVPLSTQKERQLFPLSPVFLLPLRPHQYMRCMDTGVMFGASQHLSLCPQAQGDVLPSFSCERDDCFLRTPFLAFCLHPAQGAPPQTWSGRTRRGGY